MSSPSPTSAEFLCDVYVSTFKRFTLFRMYACAGALIATIRMRGALVRMRGALIAAVRMRGALIATVRMRGALIATRLVFTLTCNVVYIFW